MSENAEGKPQATSIAMPLHPTRRLYDSTLLNSARLPFLIALTAVGAVPLIFVAEKITKVHFTVPINETDSPFVRILLYYGVDIFLLLISSFAIFIGYRLIRAAGIVNAHVIPPEDYALLSPLVADGKTEAIDQYVRLSSLTGFTGTFTQLGFTGLPLATMALTLIFAALTLLKPESFVDLTKLTLGAFIGSFVQRQAEWRSQNARDNVSDAVLARRT